MRFYLFGRPFVLHTDCKAMSFGSFLKKSTANAIIRWSVELSEYEFEIRFVPGKKNIVSDYLSRPALPDQSSGLYDYIKKGILQASQEEDEQNTKTEAEKKQKEEGTVNLVTDEEIEASPPPRIGDPNVLRSIAKDPTLTKVRQWLTKDSEPEDPNQMEPEVRAYYNKLSRLKLGQDKVVLMKYADAGVQRFRWLVCVPEDQIERLLEINHVLTGAHQSAEKTENRIRKKLFFPGMRDRVSLFGSSAKPA